MTRAPEPPGPPADATGSPPKSSRPPRPHAPPGTLRKTLVGIDQVLLRIIGQGRFPLLTRAMKVLTHFGDPASWTFLVIFLALAGAEGRALAVRIALGAGLATVVSQVLKLWFRRPRPTRELPGFEARVSIPDPLSFPSGHTSAAFGVAVALAGQGTALGTLSLLLACGIGYSRMYLGAHYPLDVLAGVGVGVVSGLVARGLL